MSDKPIFGDLKVDEDGNRLIYMGENSGWVEENVATYHKGDVVPIRGGPDEPPEPELERADFWVNIACGVFCVLFAIVIASWVIPTAQEVIPPEYHRDFFFASGLLALSGIIAYLGTRLIWEVTR